MTKRKHPDSNQAGIEADSKKTKLTLTGQQLTDLQKIKHLHSAAANGQTEVVKLLLEQAPQLIGEKATGGFTVLHTAAYHGQTEVVELLLEKASQLISVNSAYGCTALHIAAENGQTDVVKLLLEQAPQLIDKTATNGFTVLHTAAYRGQTEVVKLLLEQAPQLIGEKDHLGSSALSYAMSQNKQEVAQAIKSAEAAYNLVHNGSFLLESELDQVFLLKCYQSYILKSGFVDDEQSYIGQIERNESIQAIIKGSLIKVCADFIEEFDTLCAKLYHIKDANISQHSFGKMVEVSYQMSDKTNIYQPLIKFYQSHKITLSDDLLIPIHYQFSKIESSPNQ